MKKIRVSGPLYKWLGHFSNPKYLDQGHNDCVETKEGRICFTEKEDEPKSMSSDDQKVDTLVKRGMGKKNAEEYLKKGSKK